MGRKRHAPEKIIRKLREAEVELGRGMKTPEVCRKLGITEQTYYRRPEGYGGLRLDQKTLCMLQEAQVLIERWRQHDNRFRPHSSLGYRPPAPEAIEIGPLGMASLPLAVAQGPK